jgi:hypothetical protein
MRPVTGYCAMLSQWAAVLRIAHAQSMAIRMVLSGERSNLSSLPAQRRSWSGG